MKLLRTASIRTRLIFLMTLALVPALALMVDTTLRLRRNILDVTAERLSQTASLISHEQNRHLEGGRQLLVGLARLPVFQGDDAAAMATLLKSILPEYPFYTDLAVVDTAGQVFASASPTPTLITAMERSYIQDAAGRKQFTVGHPVIGKGGVGELNCYQPVVAADGTVRRLLLVVLNLPWVLRDANQCVVSDNTVFAMVNQDGCLLAQSPEPAHGIGKQASAWPALMAARHESPLFGTFTTTDAAGQRVLTSYIWVRGTGGGGFFYGLASVPEAPVVADANQLLRDNLWLLALVVALGYGIAWVAEGRRFVNRIRALQKAAQELGAGKLDARTGLRYDEAELGSLALAFDQMAAARQFSEEKLVQEHNRLRALIDQIPDRIYIKDRDGRYLLDNLAHAQFLGTTSPADVAGKTVHDFFPKELADRFHADDLQIIHDGHSQINKEEPITDRAGNHTVVLTTKIPFRSTTGEIVGLACISRDITTRKASS